MKIKIKQSIIYKALYIMGNYASTITNINKNKNSNPVLNFKELNNNNSEFLSKLNEVATDYILGQNFQDMIRLTNSKYCNDLVIITSKILKKSFFSNQIQVMYKQISESDIYSGQSILGILGISGISGSSQKEQTKKMCTEIAKYYVKIAHLFAAIITTLNPVFSWRSSASSSRAILSPHIPPEPPVRTGVEQGVEGVEDVEKTTLENKHYISEIAKDIKIENLNFCNSRIADLMDMDELTDLLHDESIVNGEQPVSVIKIKTKLCSSNLNNSSSAGTGTGTRNVKTVYDLPGFAELSRLYNDKYNASKGRFDKMSAKSRDEKKRNIDLLYTLFTGNPNPPKDIKSFRDIPLHSFSDTADCSSPDSMLNKTYVGNTKDKLFVDYVEQVKKMIYDSNMIRNSLLEIIDSIFITNTSSESGDKMKYIIDPNLTYEELNNLIDETRKIILKLYVNCEKNFIHTLKILQGIIEAQMFETGQRQIRELEKSIDAEYAV
jgi:hypothetical protein